MNYIVTVLLFVYFFLTCISTEQQQQQSILHVTYQVINPGSNETDDWIDTSESTDPPTELVTEEVTDPNLRFDPNAEKWSLVKLDPSLNKPKSVFEYSTVRPSTETVNSSSHVEGNKHLNGGKNVTHIHSPIISSHKGQVVNSNPVLHQGLAGSTAMRLLTAPLRNLVMRSFEGYRRLMKDAHRIEDAMRSTLGLPKRVRLRSLDPLDLPEPVVLEHRDKNIPILGKLVFTLSDIMVSGLSNFRVEQLDGHGRNLYFQHLIPHLDSVANYTMDYHLFDAIPFRVSSGHLLARVPNARVKGSFQIFPDIVNVWFKVAQLNLTTWAEDLNIRFYPEYLISERFAIDKSTVDKIHTAFNYFLPNITDVLKLTYSKAIEMKLV